MICFSFQVDAVCDELLGDFLDSNLVLANLRLLHCAQSIVLAPHLLHILFEFGCEFVHNLVSDSFEENINLLELLFLLLVEHLLNAAICV